ncbi:hypothetical protein E2I00_019165 [Balaenoptera physalus]|uniref:Cyclin N-terminal domain-containing protein n=1 Tax=Balaenoptera physalus TaxID=9770 RepID=A0A643CBW8_BALPH|nr:hypothetical protein E2I00_019165 [Balaenoptera physalus]
MDRPVRPRLASLSDFQFGAVATETIEDALLHFAHQNEQAVQEAAGRMGSFRETRIVEFVFLLSEQWCLEKSVSYQAVEILERFMIKQAENICRQASIQLREKTEPQNWRALKEQLFNKFILRLVSCVQLASKLSFHYKSLNFQINLPTPLAYVEMLLEVLGYNGCLVPATQLYATCLTLLDLVYLLHEPVYESLLRASIENSTPSQLQGEKFISVKEDFMLLAVGIIAASAFIQNHECWSQVAGHLQSITGIALESIAELSYAILTHSVGTSTPGRQRPVPPHLVAGALRAATSPTHKAGGIHPK